MELYEQAKKKCKDPILLIEQEVTLTEYVEGCFGTCDCLIASEDTLYIVDYKHGRGIPVNAENNTQMMMYALGALLIFDSLYDIKKNTYDHFSTKTFKYLNVWNGKGRNTWLGRKCFET